MKEESKKGLKVLSKIMEILTIIGKVCSIIAIPCIVLVMVCTPYFVNNVNVTDKELSFKAGKTKVVLLDDKKGKDDLKITVAGNEVEEKEVVEIINNALKDTSKNTIIVGVEIALAFAIATIVFGIIVLNFAIKLFKNFGNKETPFIDENVTYLRKMGIYMIVSFILSVIGSVAVEIITGYDIGSNFNTYSALEVIVVFIISYIFEYGVELQSKSKKTLYEIEK